MIGNRAARVGEEILRALGRIIREELRDPRIGFVTITAVKVSADLRHARVFATALGVEVGDPSIETLNHSAAFLRRSLARDLGLRFTPSLRFVLDESVDRGRRLEGLFDQIRSEPPPAPDVDATDEPPGS